MMTREEAIEYAESKKMRLEALVYNDDCKYGNYAMYSDELSFVNAALSALQAENAKLRAELEKAKAEFEEERAAVVDVDKAILWLKDYVFEDSRKIYTNGSRLIPYFRVLQAFRDKAYNGLQEGRA